MPRLRAFRFPTLAIAALAAQPALAQISEADRLARCQNNREALARLEATRGSYATAEQISRARTALTTIWALEGQINRNFEQARMDLLTLDQLRRQPPSPRTANEIAQANARLQEYTRDNIAVAERIRSAAAPFGLNCLPRDYACSRQLYQALARYIDTAVARQSQYPAFLQQIASYQTNLIALRCDQVGTVIAVDTAIPNFAGSWRGAYFNADYILSQSGASVGWTSASIGETARGDFANGVLTMTWNGRRGQGTATGTVVTDANGVATEIRWSNGNVFRRQ